MRRIILYMFTTLDGFIAGPDGEFDDYEPSAEEMVFANGFFDSLDGMMFGRVVYEMFEEYWNSIDPLDRSADANEAEFARIFQSTTKVVFSRTLTDVPDDTILIRDDLAPQVLELKQRPGRDLALMCGPELLASLVDLDLVDECLLLVKPKATGRGLALFGEIRKPLRLGLLTARVFESGVVAHHYEVLRSA